MNFTFLPIKNSQRLCLISKESEKLCNQYTWRTTWDKRYIIANKSKTAKELLLHKLLCKGGMVDHINGNTFDNRLENLRLTSPSLNQANKSKNKRRSFTSKYKGVTFCKNTYRAFIKVNGNQKALGSFSREEDAARAYDNAAKIAFGSHAKLNFNEASS